MSSPQTARTDPFYDLPVEQVHESIHRLIYLKCLNLHESKALDGGLEGGNLRFQLRYPDPSSSRQIPVLRGLPSIHT